jgi:hypothetical protein
MMFEPKHQPAGVKKTELDTLGKEQPGIHSDFPLRMGYWSWNLKPKVPTRDTPPEKIKFFFTSAQIVLLSECPCRGKIGVDRHNPDAFVGYLYPESTEGAEQAIQWATRFKRL